MGDSLGSALLASPLPGPPKPYGYDPAATWEERFVPVGRGSKILNYVSYAPESFTLQVVYISGKIVYVHNVSADVQTAMFLASNAEQYVLQLVSVTTP